MMMTILQQQQRLTVGVVPREPTTMVMKETKSPSVPVNQTGHHHGLHHLHVPKLKKLILSDKVEEKILLECVGALK